MVGGYTEVLQTTELRCGHLRGPDWRLLGISVFEYRQPILEVAIEFFIILSFHVVITHGLINHDYTSEPASELFLKVAIVLLQYG